ncbi:MAG: hypothetical protein ACXWUG_07725 [Polyangiales bacterium]
MAIAQRKPFLQPVPAEGPRAKSLRPFERRRVSPETHEALSSFERAAIAYEKSTRDEPAYARLRVAAGSTMDALLRDREALPEDLSAEIDRWEEGEFGGSRADVELANYAIAELLGSPIRIGSAPAADTDDDE